MFTVQFLILTQQQEKKNTRKGSDRKWERKRREGSVWQESVARIKRNYREERGEKEKGKEPREKEKERRETKKGNRKTVRAFEVGE